MSKLKIAILLLVIIVAFILLPKAKLFIDQDVCLDHGGKWSYSTDRCIEPSCADDGSCEPSYRNVEICLEISLGIEKSELYFLLGQPKFIDGNIYHFHGGGASNDIIAIIEEDKLININCKT